MRYFTVSMDAALTTIPVEHELVFNFIQIDFNYEREGEMAYLRSICSCITTELDTF